MKRMFLVTFAVAFSFAGPVHAGELRQKYADLYRKTERETGNIRGSHILGQDPSRARLVASIKKVRRIEEARRAKVVAVQTQTVGPDSESGGGGESGGSGGYAIPESIVQCESGGSYTARNPSSGAYGAYQILESTAAAYNCDLSTAAGQDACAAKIWAGGAGRSQWSC